MSKIKNILQTDSIEQKRRLANSIELGREDKMALITNTSNRGGNGGSVSKYAPRYYDISKVPAGTRFDFAASLKGRSGDNIYIFPTMLAGDVRCEQILAFSYIPMYIDFGNGSRFIYDAIEFVRLMVDDDEEVNEMLSLITEITEEEFYNIKPN